MTGLEKNRIPILILVSVACGILIRHYMSLGVGMIALIFGVGILAYFLVVSYLKSSGRIIGKYRLHFIWLMLLFCGLGAAADYVGSASYPVDKPHHLLHQKARVLDIVQKNSGELLTVELLDLDSKANIFTPASTLVRGDIILIDSPLFPIEESRSTPHLKKNNMRTWKSVGENENGNFYKTDPQQIRERYLRSQIKKGILYSGAVSTDKIYVLGHYNRPGTLSTDLRDRLEIGIEHTRLSERTKSFLITLLLGDKSYLDSELRKSFSEVGISHILAVSGLHTGILASMFMAILFPFTVIGRRKWKYLLSLIMLWGFVFVTGMAASTVRSAVMMSFFILGTMSERKIGSGSPLCWAGIFILIFSPSSLFDPGFQLGFLCVAGLTVFCERLNPIDSSERRYLRKLVMAVLSTLIATLSTWVVVAYYFGTLPTMFLPANLFILPLVPIYMLLALVYFGMASFGFEVRWIAFLLDKGIELTDSFCSFISSDGASVIRVQPDLHTVALWLLGIALIGLSLHIAKRRLATAVTGTACLGASLLMLVI